MKEYQLSNTSQNRSIRPEELLKASVWKPLSVSIGLMFFQQFTGINAMVFYTVDIFESAGSTLDGRYATIIIGVVQFICTTVSGFSVVIPHFSSNYDYTKHTFECGLIFNCYSIALLQSNPLKMFSWRRWIVVGVAFYFSIQPVLHQRRWRPWALSFICSIDGGWTRPPSSTGSRCYHW